MNFGIRNSGRQGFYDEEEQQQQGKHLHLPHQYPCSNSSSSSSPNYERHQYHRGWLDSPGGEGGGGGGRPASSQPVMEGGGESDQQHLPPVVEVEVVEREHMFDKVVTPSDVGKLNRLVIPKQHAERYFPLDSSTNEKGLLLNFEDRNGKPWRFRYSYWNSSQSYVMTKGWSRFVKEKKLDAGDIVSFQRGVGDLGKDRLFIDWRRRPDHHAPPPHHHPQLFPHHHHHHLNNFSFHHQRSSSSSNSSIMNNIIHQQQQQHPMVPWNPIFLQSHRGGEGYGLGNSYGGNGPAAASNYGRYNVNTTPGGPANTPAPPCPGGGSVIYLRSVSAHGQQQQQQQQLVQIQQQQQLGILLSSGSGNGIIDHQVVHGQPPPVVFESVPVVHGEASAAAKRLRLFGVNMDFLPIHHHNSHHFSTTNNTTTSSSSSTIPYIQLIPNYNPSPSDKPKPSMSLDFDI